MDEKRRRKLRKDMLKDCLQMMENVSGLYQNKRRDHCKSRT